MTDIKVIHNKMTVEIDVYEWDCPKCACWLQDRGKPPGTFYEALCKSCENVYEKERYQKITEEFQKDHKHLIGAKIVRVVPDAEYWREDANLGIDTIILEVEDALYKIRFNKTSGFLYDKKIEKNELLWLKKVYPDGIALEKM